MPKRVIISGGGTGGHVFPAIAIGKELKSRFGNSVEVLFVGAEGKLEADRVPKAGFEIELLPIKGFSRTNLISNWDLPFKLMRSFLTGNKILRRFKPDVVIGVGGYASAPMLKLANWYGINTLIQEQNSHAGLTNRLLSKGVNTVCVAFEGMQRFFVKSKVVITGNPVRPEFKRSIDPLEAKNTLGLEANRKVLLIVGGSLGARTFNEAMKGSVDLIRQRNDVQIIWQHGRLYQGFAKEEVAKLDNVMAMAFIDRMDLAIAAADVVVTRAGAITLSEMAIMGKACLVVPSPNVTDDHQTKNAKSLIDQNACVLVRDSESDELIERAMELIDDDESRAKLEGAILQHGRSDADEKIVNEIVELINT